MQIRNAVVATLMSLRARLQRASNALNPFESQRPYFNSPNLTPSNRLQRDHVADVVARRLANVSVPALRAEREAEQRAAVHEAERVLRDAARVR